MVTFNTYIPISMQSMNVKSNKIHTVVVVVVVVVAVVVFKNMNTNGNIGRVEG